MPLVLEFKAGDKIIINGAVIENGATNTKLVVHNRAAILREKEILSAEDAVTPASRVYFALQCAYIFPAKAEQYEEQFSIYIEEYLAACPSAAPIAKKVIAAIRTKDYYQALREAQHLIEHESNLVDNLQEDVQKILRKDKDEDKGTHPE